MANADRYVVPDHIPEKNTWEYSGYLTDANGTAIASASLSTLTLTIYNSDVDLTIVNSVNGTNILNTGRGTVAATSGLLTVRFLPADTTILDNTQDFETHIALIQGTYNSGADAFNYEVEHVVRNLHKVS